MSMKSLLLQRCSSLLMAGSLAAGSLVGCGLLGADRPDRSDRSDRSTGATATAPAASAPVAPAALPPVSAAGDTVIVDDARTGSPVELRLDQQLVVRLHYEINSTAQWELTDFTPGPLAPPGPSRFDTHNGEAAVVLGGDQVWRFKPTATGQATLNFAYRTPRSREVASRTASFVVTVR